MQCFATVHPRPSRASTSSKPYQAISHLSSATPSTTAITSPAPYLATISDTCPHNNKRQPSAILSRLLRRLNKLRGGATTPLSQLSVYNRDQAYTSPNPSPPYPSNTSMSHNSEYLRKPSSSLPEVGLGLKPVPRGSLWQSVSFSWVDPLMKQGNEKPLEMSDLYTVRPEYRMANLSARFQSTYIKEAEKALAR